MAYTLSPRCRYQHIQAEALDCQRRQVILPVKFAAEPLRNLTRKADFYLKSNSEKITSVHLDPHWSDRSAFRQVRGE